MLEPESIASDMTGEQQPSLGLSGVRDIFERSPAHAPRRIIPAGEAIHEADTPADRIFFIHRGEARVYQPGPDGSVRLLDILGPGDWFGVAALAGASTCEKRAVAVTAVSLSEMTVAEFLNTLEQNPPAAIGFIWHLAHSLHTTRTNASRFVFDDCERRILKTLIDFSRTAAASPLEGDTVVLRITHNQLAQAIGVARETVSLTLTKLRRQNLLQTGRNKLVFNPVALREFEVRGGAARKD